MRKHPRRCDDTQVQKQTRAFFFVSPTAPRRHPAVFPAFLSPFASSRRQVIVSRRDQSATDRATGNKTAPSTILLEKLCMHRSHGPLRCPSPFHEGCPTRRWVDALCPARSLKPPGYLRGGPTCLPAATRYFVTKLISRGGYQFRSNGPGWKRIGLRSSKLAKGTLHQTCSGSRRVTVITRNNL